MKRDAVPGSVLAHRVPKEGPRSLLLLFQAAQWGGVLSLGTKRKYLRHEKSGDRFEHWSILFFWFQSPFFKE